ncbi:hypothetical protein ACFFJX_12890 [Pseudarcicella hirudinis]|uniref:hypothetical protein n=1 Tax=Pseudarcicella hirudinis TaxID=1079859 RepID=UPI0035EE14A1
MTLEYWQRHTYDILGRRVLAVPSEFGGSLPAENYGIMNSNGIEIELGYKKNSVGKKISDMKSKVISIMPQIL